MKKFSKIAQGQDFCKNLINLQLKFSIKRTSVYKKFQFFFKINIKIEKHISKIFSELLFG